MTFDARRLTMGCSAYVFAQRRGMLPARVCLSEYPETRLPKSVSMIEARMSRVRPWFLERTSPSMGQTDYSSFG